MNQREWSRPGRSRSARRGLPHTQPIRIHRLPLSGELGHHSPVPLEAAIDEPSARGPIRLVLDQGAAFSLLGHSCGGIQEQVYVTGFGSAPGGYPEGDAYLSTRCGGSGRGGGYKTTTYTAAASVVWNWFGQTRSFARLQGPAGGGPEFSAE